MTRRFARSQTAWLAAALSVVITTTGAVVAGAAVTGQPHHHSAGGPVICRPDGRRTMKSYGVYYIVRNDVFAHERECIKILRPGAGFAVVRSQAHSHRPDNDAFPEVIYGCAWGLCTKNSLLPRQVYRFKSLITSWGASWRGAPGKFNAAYDIWFGHRHTIHGHALGAEMMIWIGTRQFAPLVGFQIYVIDGIRWWYARHRACGTWQIGEGLHHGCWNYILFFRVRPSTHAIHLNLVPFFQVAERQRQLAWWWFLKSIDVGFEIWRGGQGLAVHRYWVNIKLRPIRHHRHR